MLEGKELRLTPDVLAGIYQCNISHLDDPQIQTSNPDIRQALRGTSKHFYKKKVACNRLPTCGSLHISLVPMQPSKK